MMEYSISSVAKSFCEKTDWSLSNLELNKLCYLAHMMALGEKKGGEGLVSNAFEAWDYGPVSPALYHKVKSFGADPVGNVFHQYQTVEETFGNKIISDLASKTWKPGQLVAITHWEDGAWSKNYKPNVKGILISNEDIYEEYKKRA